VLLELLEFFGRLLAAELLVFLLAAVTFVAFFDELSFTGSTTFELAKFSSEEDCAEDELKPSSQNIPKSSSVNEFADEWRHLGPR
jgi:hypothetical protein